MAKKVLYWTPRILGILAILFMMMFSLDCFGENEPLKDQLICIFMHNIPAFVCIVVLIFAWKWELIGGILFILVFIAAGIFFDSFIKNPASLIVISPFLLTGVLFIVNYRLNKKKAAT
jgi:hypothetical protein